MELLEEGWPVEEVGEIVLDVSVRTTHSPRWEDILTERGELKPMSVMRGPPRILDPATMVDFNQLVREYLSTWVTTNLDEISDCTPLIHGKHVTTTA